MRDGQDSQTPQNAILITSEVTPDSYRLREESAFYAASSRHSIQHWMEFFCGEKDLIDEIIELHVFDIKMRRQH